MLKNLQELDARYAGKAIAAMLANEGELVDYLEVIGAGKTLSKLGQTAAVH